MAKTPERDAKLCLALDVNTADEALVLVNELREQVSVFKIGLQLFTAEGHKVVEKVLALGVEVFLDLKFHDIPNTVGQVARVATAMGVSFFNVHVSGCSEMMRRAVDSSHDEAIKRSISPPAILGVTVLTSIGERELNAEMNVHMSPMDQVCHLAQLAQSAGLTGIIASPQEISVVRAKCGTEFLIVTPGVRPAGAQQADQKRIATPAEAVAAGANLLVIGRPITAAVDRVAAARAILEEMRG